MKDYYWQRIDRNLGIITKSEQELLSKSCVAIAGCGGMGGQVAASLARIGVGKIKIADNQVFDLSNINRQFGAKISTVGVNKAEATFREIYQIVDDVEIEIFPEGIDFHTAEDFVKDADIICDAIEFYELKYRIYLHQVARKAGVVILNCNVVGFGSRIFLFTPNSMTIEEFLEADIDSEMNEELIWRLIRRFAPDLPADISENILKDWVFGQHKVPIFGGTPLISSGILVVRLCLHLLGYEQRPWVKKIPPMPAYGYFDSAQFSSYIHTGKWW